MNKLIRSIVFFISLTGIFTIIVGGFAGAYFYNRLTRDLPKIEKLSDYRPKAVTQFLAEDGTLIAEIWDERRYPVALDQIPQHVINAFLAAEDASFYEHSGIDFMGVMRAVWVNLTSRKTKQGASTITQQIVKELLLSRERTYERKIKEALLSYRLERGLSKNEILSIYLNQIFLGSGSYGVKAAAKVHFHKELAELTIAEAAFLGSLPKKPSELTRPENLSMAKDRQRYVLGQMLNKGFISKEEFDNATKEELRINPSQEDTLYASPYFSSHAIKVVENIFQEKFPEYSIRDPGGYVIHTTLDSLADRLAETALKNGLMEVDKRQGWKGALGNINDVGERPLTWTELSAGAELKLGKIYRGLVTSVDRKRGDVLVKLGKIEGRVNVNEANWAKTKAIIEPGGIEIKKIEINPISQIKNGDIIEVSLKNQTVDNEAGQKKAEDNTSSPVSFKLDQTPITQSAMVVMDVHSGAVKSIIGGFDYQQSKFNRATQAYLQPGSSFKPFIYLEGLEVLHLTPSSLVPDEPISFPTAEGVWSPQNFDEKFLGPITLRTALQKSRNVVSVYLLNKIGIDKVINIAKKFGISTPLARNMSLALGTSEVHLNEMVRAYGAIAASGYLPDAIVVRKILDRAGNEIYQAPLKNEMVVDPRSAFMLQHMMRGVVDRGTAQTVKQLGRPVAGKTGTTNDHMDAWFIGYTPDLVAGVWVGFDVKRSLGKLETGGKAAAPIFLKFMQDYLGDSPISDFIPPEGVSPVAIDVNSGVPVNPEDPDAFIEYFRTDLIGQQNNQYPSDNTDSSEDSHGTQEGRDYLTNTDF